MDILDKQDDGIIEILAHPVQNTELNRLLKICPYDAYFLIFAKFLGFRRAPIGPG